MSDLSSPIAERFNVLKTLSQHGGMGSLYLVTRIGGDGNQLFALKACKLEGEEPRRRFKREVRILLKFQGNSKIVEIVDHALDADPPSFVMKYYKEGDLMTLQQRMTEDPALQEYWFSEMIDCVAELHQKAVIHRDIKPQNFLIDGSHCVVSDLGLCVEHESSTIFTRKSQTWGTEGYAPPEFAAEGGFMNATIRADIYMLGKTFYVLASGGDPRYLTETGLRKPLFYVIDKCCKHDPAMRFQDLAALRQSLKGAYDVMLGRCNGFGRAQQTLNEINDKLQSENRYKPEEIATFVDILAGVSEGERDQILRGMPNRMFAVFALEPCESSLAKLLPLYCEMLDRLLNPNFGYAETIADQMREVVVRSKNPELRMSALRMAVRMAGDLNRFAAMDTCNTLVADVDEPNFAFLVAEYLRENPASFLAKLEPQRCKHAAIREALKK
jgi:serine/threonine protein kinase